MQGANAVIGKYAKSEASVDGMVTVTATACRGKGAVVVVSRANSCTLAALVSRLGTVTAVAKARQEAVTANQTIKSAFQAAIHEDGVWGGGIWRGRVL